MDRSAVSASSTGSAWSQPRSGRLTMPLTVASVTVRGRVNRASWPHTCGASTTVPAGSSPCRLSLRRHPALTPRPPP